MLVFGIVPILLYFIIRKLFFTFTPKNICNKHVVITGGSSGIGKATAILAAKKGAHVTIIARNKDGLNEAAAEIQKHRLNDSQMITKLSLDVSNCTRVKREFHKLEEIVAPIFMLINCAGIAICGRVEDISEEDARKMLNINYLGTLYPIQAVIPTMKNRGEGIIVLTSSIAGLMGLYGFSAYSSTKFALRGLAESIRMELKPYNISITLTLPPDTNTPGYMQENKSKPEETKLISESGGLYEPDIVAEKLLNDALCGTFMSTIGVESFLVKTLCTGMSPFQTWCEVFLQMALLGLTRFIGAYYLKEFDKIIMKCSLKNKKSH